MTTITLPNWMDDQAWAAIDWSIVALAIQIIYGLYTHHHSMRQVREHNKSGYKQVTTSTCMGFFFLRVFLSIPLRLIGLIAGIISVIIIPIVRTIIGVPAHSHDTREWIKDCFGLAWHWHTGPKYMSGCYIWTTIMPPATSFTNRPPRCLMPSRMMYSPSHNRSDLSRMMNMTWAQNTMPMNIMRMMISDNVMRSNATAFVASVTTECQKGNNCKQA